MELRLRGHHLLCLLGYQGMGYSADFTANMTRVYQNLQEQPETLVTLIEGPDDLCACYPPEAEDYHCLNQSVIQRDEQVIHRLGLQIGTQVQWSTVMDRVRAHLVPEDIQVLCNTCSWRSLGVCEAGIQRIQQGEGLSPLPR
jgi:hypothetical protein